MSRPRVAFRYLRQTPDERLKQGRHNFAGARIARNVSLSQFAIEVSTRALLERPVRRTQRPGATGRSTRPLWGTRRSGPREFRSGCSIWVWSAHCESWPSLARASAFYPRTDGLARRTSDREQSSRARSSPSAGLAPILRTLSLWRLHVVQASSGLRRPPAGKPVKLARAEGSLEPDSSSG